MHWPSVDLSLRRFAVGAADVPKREEVGICREFVSQARQHIDVYRPLASCRPSVHIDSCRTCADEFWRICLLHGGGFGHLELVAGGSGVLLVVFASGGRNCAGVGEIWHAGQCRFFRLAFCFACRLCGEALCAQTAGKGIKRRLYG